MRTAIVLVVVVLTNHPMRMTTRVHDGIAPATTSIRLWHTSCQDLACGTPGIERLPAALHLHPDFEEDLLVEAAGGPISSSRNCVVK
jgi:hypothetical protein